MVLDFATIVALQIAAIQAAADIGVFLNFRPGSILRAWVDSNALLVTAMMQQILNLFMVSRASTSSGTDLDSWMADFGVVRVAAVEAYGNVTFSRFSSGDDVIIPVGSTVETSDGTCQYMVVVDTSRTEYSPSLIGYILPAGQLSTILPVVATTPGAVGNAAAGAVNIMAGAIPGIDKVSNSVAFVTGMDTETDEVFRARFITTLQSLGRATKRAVEGAVAAVSPGLRYNVVENFNFDGTPNDGYFYVVIDDGTGHPSTGLINSVSSAVETVRPLCSAYGVFAPAIVSANVTMDITIPSTLSRSDITETVRTAMTNYINSLGLGERLSYTMLAKVAYEADSNVLNVTNVVANSTTFDIIAQPSQVVKAGVVVVN